MLVRFRFRSKVYKGVSGKSTIHRKFWKIHDRGNFSKFYGFLRIFRVFGTLILITKNLIKNVNSVKLRLKKDKINENILDSPLDSVYLAYVNNIFFIPGVAGIFGILPGLNFFF